MTGTFRRSRNRRVSFASFTAFAPVAALGALAFGLAGCAGGAGPVYEGHSAYHAGEFDYATRRGAIATHVAGTPFGGDAAAFAARVRALMRGQNRELPADFVAENGPRTVPLYRVWVIFDAPGIVLDNRACRDATGLAGHREAGRLRLSIAFCEGDSLRSWASGSAAGISGPDDPAFARLVREVTYYMVPDDAVIEHRRISE